MSLLGCNSKVLWNDIYNQITDVVSMRADTTGIILCKYFHKIHSELLDIFYSYMQSQSFNKINDNNSLSYIDNLTTFSATLPAMKNVSNLISDVV